MLSEFSLREVIVSHTDENGILQLFRMKEDGSNSLQLTHSKYGCRMPSVSPNGRNIHVKQVDWLSLWLSHDGTNARSLVSGGMNIILLATGLKAYCLDETQPGKKRDPANSQPDNKHRNGSNPKIVQ